MLLFGILAATAVLLALLIAYICYRLAFYAPARKPLPEGVVDTPEGAIYDPFRESMIRWARESKKCFYLAFWPQRPSFWRF